MPSASNETAVNVCQTQRIVEIMSEPKLKTRREGRAYLLQMFKESQQKSQSTFCVQCEQKNNTVAENEDGKKSLDFSMYLFHNL